jgi:NAD(P)H-hydrate epimerase
VLTVAQMREADHRAIEEFGIPGVVLMENAGRGAAELAEEMLAGGGGRRVLVLAGRGNNGGDGFVVARHLHNASVDVRVRVLAGLDDIRGDARVNLDVIRRMGLDLSTLRLPGEEKALAAELENCDLVIDAMLGTGTTGDIRDPFRTAIDLVNRSGLPVLAVDVPSGLDADTGDPLGTCLIATRTATFAAVKAGMNNPSAARYLGILTVIDIGLPRELLTH